MARDDMTTPPALDELLRLALSSELVAQASGTPPDEVAQWSPAQRAQAEGALMTRVKAYLQTHARLMLELGTRYHLPADLPVGRAIEAGWLPASAAGALFALWTSPEGQLAQEVLDRAQAVGALAAALLLVERARRAARAYDQEEPAGPVP